MYSHFTRIRSASSIQIKAPEIGLELSKENILRECRFGGTEFISKINILNLLRQIAYPCVHQERDFVLPS